MKIKYYKMMTCCRAKKDPYIWSKTNMEEFGLCEEDFLSGKDFSDFEGRIRLEVGKYGSFGNLDDGLQGTMISLPIISPVVKQKISEKGISELQFIPVDVITENGVVEYWIINCMYCVNAFDYDYSEYYGEDFFSGNPKDKYFIKYVKKYALHEELVLGHDMFVLNYEPYKRVIVSSRIKNIFLKNKFSGWNFYPVHLTRDNKIIE